MGYSQGWANEIQPGPQRLYVKQANIKTHFKLLEQIKQYCISSDFEIWTQSILEAKQTKHIHPLSLLAQVSTALQEKKRCAAFFLHVTRCLVEDQVHSCKEKVGKQDVSWVQNVVRQFGSYLPLEHIRELRDARPSTRGLGRDQPMVYRLWRQPQRRVATLVRENR